MLSFAARIGTTWKGKTGPLKLAGTFTKFESKPLAPVALIGRQGETNADWVAVWFPWVKLKYTVAPSAAVTSDGVKTEVPLDAVTSATVMTIVCPAPAEVVVALWATVEVMLPEMKIANRASCERQKTLEVEEQEKTEPAIAIASRRLQCRERYEEKEVGS